MVGQTAIVDTLRNQVIHGRIAHAYLFCGSRGTGKTSTAKILAKAINCENPRNGDPCGICPSCIRMEHDESLDVIEIDAASNNGVDEMRDLRETVKYPPQFGKYKVYIIDEVHMLSTSAFNALLKTLEEPPAHIVFILATTEPQRLPETILSRCQRFDFSRISTPAIAQRLREASEGEGAAVSDGALMAIARSAEGGMRDALSLLDMCLGYGNKIDESMVRKIMGTCDKGFIFRFADALAEENASSVFRMIDELIRDGRDPVVFARDVSHHIRCLLLAACCSDDLAGILDLTAEDAGEYRKQAARYTVTRLMRILDQYMALETEMRYSSSPRLALENASLKCCIRTHEIDAQAVYDRISELEKRIDDLSNRMDRERHIAIPSVSDVVHNSDAAESAVTDTAVKRAASGQSACGSGTQETWNELISRVKKTDPGLFSILNHGHIASMENDTFIWVPNSESDDFFLNTFSGNAKKQMISDIISSISGRTCRFDTVRRKDAASSSDISEESHIQHLYEVFGKEPVDIVDKL